MNGAQTFGTTSGSWLSWPHGRRLIIAVAAVVGVSMILAMRNSQVHPWTSPNRLLPAPFSTAPAPPPSSRRLILRRRAARRHMSLVPCVRPASISTRVCVGLCCGMRAVCAHPLHGSGMAFIPFSLRAQLLT